MKKDSKAVTDDSNELIEALLKQGNSPRDVIDLTMNVRQPLDSKKYSAVSTTKDFNSLEVSSAQ